jgi:cation diffusion facilitator CzcD-associated flavoprotein CzcO
MTDRPFRVAVIGAGMSGLYMAEMLQRRRDVEFTVYEKAGEIGGTWRDNTYPGLFVDVLSRQYEFLFQPNYDWSRKYAPRVEIFAYMKKVARSRGWYRHIRFNTEIVAARYDQAAAKWHLTTASGESDVVDFFVVATGFLAKPLLPDIAGRESFAGKSFHSARWDHSVPQDETLRWGVVGAGCSGIQITEALAWKNVNVTQFVRRPQWIHIRENPRASWWERLKLRLPGQYAKKQRELWDFIIEGDAWRLKPGPQREAMEREYRSYLDVIRDPALKKKLTPTYHLGCTRIPKSDQNYYRAVQRPNVTIESRKIARIVPAGVALDDGSVVQLDVLVYATGFDTHAYMRPMEVIGLNGVSIAEVWKDNVFSYGGIGVPGFPNMFLLYGPFAPLNNVPVPLGLEHEIGYIMKLMGEARARGAAVAPSADATERFRDKMRAAFPGTVWVGCKNWYSDGDGTPILWPLRQDEHRDFLAQVREEDLDFVPIARPDAPKPLSP